MAQSKSRANAQRPDDELPKLAPREQKFVAHYSVHFNGAGAVRFAGYETEHQRQYAVELLSKPYIQKHVEKARAELGTLHFDLANQATAMLAAMMQADRTKILDAEGNVLDPKDWPDDCKLLMAGVEVEETMIAEGAGMIRLKKVKLEAPKGIIDSVLKATGAIVDRTQLLDRHGKPTDPHQPQPIINVTVGAAPPKAKA